MAFRGLRAFQRAAGLPVIATGGVRTGLDAETLAVLDQIRPSAVEINAIESALQDRLQRISHV